MKYIIYKSESGEERYIAVIDGKPYYRSTGDNSGMKGIWLPFYGVYDRDHPIHIRRLRTDVKFMRESDIVSNAHAEFHGTLIKNSLASVMELDLLKLCGCSVDIKLKKKEITGDVQLFDRLYLQADFINSLRLTPAECFKTDINKLMKDADLNDAQIKLANTKLNLDNKPQLETNDPYLINQWLMKQDAPIKFYPDSYYQIWKSAKIFHDAEKFLDEKYVESERSRAKKRIGTNDLHQTKAILLDYTKNDSRFKRFFSGHWNRHHIRLVTDALKNDRLDTANKLVAHIRYTLGENLDATGSLSKRLDFIESQVLSSSEKIQDAIGILAETQQKDKKSSTAQQYNEYQDFISKYTKK